MKCDYGYSAINIPTVSSLRRFMNCLSAAESVCRPRVVSEPDYRPVAELIPAHKKKGLPIVIAREHPLAPSGDEWWQPMSDRAIEDWLRGR